MFVPQHMEILHVGKEQCVLYIGWRTVCSCGGAFFQLIFH